MIGLGAIAFYYAWQSQQLNNRNKELQQKLAKLREQLTRDE
jgi:hypothetical protein